MKKIVALLGMLTMLGMFVTGCAPANAPASHQSSESVPAESQETNSQDVEHGETDAPSSDGTRVKVTINDVETYAIINHTVTGQAFLELLPFEVSGYRSSLDICCAVSEELPNRPEENEVWNIGEIGWFNGWFTILCDQEEQFADEDRAIIGRFEDAYLETVVAMDGNVDITVELAEDTQG